MKLATDEKRLHLFTVPIYYKNLSVSLSLSLCWRTKNNITEINKKMCPLFGHFRWFCQSAAINKIVMHFIIFPYGPLFGRLIHPLESQFSCIFRSPMTYSIAVAIRIWYSSAHMQISWKRPIWCMTMFGRVAFTVSHFEFTFTPLCYHDVIIANRFTVLSFLSTYLLKYLLLQTILLGWTFKYSNNKSLTSAKSIQFSALIVLCSVHNCIHLFHNKNERTRKRFPWISMQKP